MGAINGAQDAGISAMYADKRRLKARLEHDLVHPGKDGKMKYLGQPEPIDSFEADEVDGELPGLPGSEPVAIKKAVGVYITSLRKRESSTTAGHVCLSIIDLAAFRMADGTHRISTPQEIAKYQQHQRDQKKHHDREEVRSKVQRMVTINAADLDRTTPMVVGALPSEERASAKK